ncbi:MAG: LuxR family transcriptional regulator [Kordiimonadaceae bacterium]|jgi:DNA-binding CsgD family transcriptional regulator|nr:LuxR family transcriptional regulator [Kordiimonadaceae bacterium]MBT6036523.1 LuxR family transcriptional regulator [Kordiimonadaceae bacterium]MBT7582558.1 LuxR family transcriptional regulator [Kordiimonadaceae bacterium]
MDYFRVSQDFIEKSKQAIELSELAELFEEVIKELGFTYFVCMSTVDPFNPPAHAVVMSNYPREWALYHAEQQYHKIDPVLQTCQSSIIPFRWSDENWRAKLTSKQIQLLDEASKFDLIDGYTVPLHYSEGFSGSCSVTFKNNVIEPEAFNTIHFISFYLYDAALKIKANHHGKKEKLLTNRQLQCLELIAQGKSDWAISKVLGVSESTVHYHVQQTLKRLKVASRTQALVHALFLGELKYNDVKVSTPDAENAINLQSTQDIIKN